MAANMFNAGLAWMGPQMKAHAGSTITYTRTGREAITLTAWPGKTVYTRVDENGFEIKAESRDYIVLAEDLVLDDVAIQPQMEDQITETVNGITYEYEVYNLDGSSAEWEWADERRNSIRIHAKQIGTR